MAVEWWPRRPKRVLRLVLWFAVFVLLAGGALAYGCAPAGP